MRIILILFLIATLALMVIVMSAISRVAGTLGPDVEPV